MAKIVPTVGVLIFDKNKVLLVKHDKHAEHITNTYGLPAGRLENDESEIECAIRELKEETGLETDKSSLHALPTTYTARIRRKSGIMNFTYKVFICSYFSGNLKESDEAEPEWINLSKVKDLNLLPNVDKIISEGVEIFKNNSRIAHNQ